MKKKNYLLILLFFPIIFYSCQKDNSNYVGLWEIVLEGEIEGDHYWYFAADGSACNDVQYGHNGISVIEDLQNCSCDDRRNLGSWMKITDQDFLQLTFQGGSVNLRILNETSDLIELEIMGEKLNLKRSSESEFRDK